MPSRPKNYKYLLRLYSVVDEFLSSRNQQLYILPEIVVSFCVVVEKILKIKLYKKNPVLIFEANRIREDDALVTVVKKREMDIETIKIRDVIKRYELMFPRDFSDADVQVLLDVYEARNQFIHGYKPDDAVLADGDNIIKKMGTVWEEISKQAVRLFGKDMIKANKPEKKYSENELEEVLQQEVEKKIKKQDSWLNIYAPVVAASQIDYFTSFSGETCPRCGAGGFSMENNSLGVHSSISASAVSQFFKGSSSDLYRCKSCNLELTRKEYEIAKKIRMLENEKAQESFNKRINSKSKL